VINVSSLDWFHWVSVEQRVDRTSPNESGRLGYSAKRPVTTQSTRVL